MIYRIQTPDGRMRIRTARIDFVEFGQQQTVFRAKSRLVKKEYDVGGETEDKAFFSLLKALSEKRLAAVNEP